MTLAVGHFERAAAQLSARAAELLAAHVTVVDEHGLTVAHSLAGNGAPDGAGGGARTPYLRVPLRFGGRQGEVIVSEPTGPEPLSPRLAEALIELMITQAAVISRLPNQYELKDKFIHDLLLGAIADEADILREAQILGMDLSRPRAVVLIEASEYILGRNGAGAGEAAARRRAQALIASVVGFFVLPDDTICGYIGNGEIAILKASATRDLEAWTADEGRPALTGPSWANLHALKRAAEALLTRLRRDTGVAITIGIGRYHPGPRGLALSYRDAGAALSLGQRFHGLNHVHCLDSLGVASFVGLADERTKVELAGRLLSPLDGEPELRHTLHVFFDANCCPSATARLLGVHRNTLSYRLDKVATLTGLDPRRFDHAIQIRLAMLLCRLQSASS